MRNFCVSFVITVIVTEILVIKYQNVCIFFGFFLFCFNFLAVSACNLLTLKDMLC